MGIREALLSTTTLAQEKVVIPDVGVVIVRAMKSGEFLALRDSCLMRGKKGRSKFDSRKFQTSLVIRCAYDEQGQRIFSDQDAEAIDEMPSTVVEKITDAAARLCGITPEDEEAMGEASAPAEAGASSSTSPNSSDAPSAS